MTTIRNCLHEQSRRLEPRLGLSGGPFPDALREFCSDVNRLLLILCLVWTASLLRAGNSFQGSGVTLYHFFKRMPLGEEGVEGHEQQDHKN
ncbi:hypothetical protein HAT2_00686 [Candidatus Similichlamydia laticola]|uniref:Uncharacterized protein n=1 Tax=Candidatus Similichlamydia laticola TaxID=2170265 RepID=A0A369KJQ2_9BACT|nr:hypothetical protein HAT2_00686 [Candidatus Similichlamydia laticola]